MNRVCPYPHRYQVQPVLVGYGEHTGDAKQHGRQPIYRDQWSCVNCDHALPLGHAPDPVELHSYS